MADAAAWFKANHRHLSASIAVARLDGACRQLDGKPLPTPSRRRRRPRRRPRGNGHSPALERIRTSSGSRPSIRGAPARRGSGNSPEPSAAPARRSRAPRRTYAPVLLCVPDAHRSALSPEALPRRWLSSMGPGGLPEASAHRRARPPRGARPALPDERVFRVAGAARRGLVPARLRPPSAVEEAARCLAGASFQLVAAPRRSSTERLAVAWTCSRERPKALVGVGDAPSPPPSVALPHDLATRADAPAPESSSNTASATRLARRPAPIVEAWWPPRW